MTTPKASTIQVIDSLAEITGFQDREFIERSLVRTLSELVPSREFRLYRAFPKLGGEIDLVLIALARRGTVVTYPDHDQRLLPPHLIGEVGMAVSSGEVIQSPSSSGDSVNIVYPVYDKHGQVYAVLIQGADQPTFEHQRLTHGLLRIYTNYLALLEESHRDKLTNLLNRETLDSEITKHILHCLEQEHAPAATPRRRDDHPECIWLCLIDVDHFKRINDTWGHLYGDEVLILLARLLESIFRRGDLLFRYGGEEFVALFKTRHRQDAESLCERVRHTVEHHELPRIGPVTVSLGMTEIRHQSGASEAIEQADRALYFAKRNGRNQTRLYRTLIDSGLLSEPIEEQGGAVDFF